MTHLFTAVQALAVLGVLLGVAMVLPLWPSVLVDSALVLVLSVAAERVVSGRTTAPSARRSRAQKSTGGA